ncbi:nucleoporin complex subunit 54-domain-containing protein [Umbelopsis sp. AD052]|nr:nucleoporin complex subunit 54-domain-containing protein [Umbelopsis sp. AD052]
MAFTFGSKPAAPTASPFGGGFGTNTGGSFGSTSAAPAANAFSFGNNASSAAPPTSTTPGFGFGASAAPPTPGFGTNTTTPNSTGLFGNTQQQQTGGFGTNTSQPSLFGSNTTATSTAPSMFGSNTAASSAPSLFGSNTATSSAPGLFGSNPSTGSNLFGTNTATSTAPSLFGNTSTSQPSLFGGQSTTTPSLFGSTTQNATPSLFGNTGGTSLFGSKPTTLGGTGSMFGAQQPTIVGANANAQQQQNQQVWQYLSQQEQSAQQLNQRLLPGQHANPQYIWQSLALIKSEWDPNSPNCKFKHYFYNIVHPSEVQRFTKPPNEDDKAWEMAMKNNPDPSCMVPVRAVGFEALRTRIETQDRQCQAHRIKLEQLDQKMKEVRRKHTIETIVKLQEYKRRHIDLTQRVIQFLKYAQILRNKGFSIENDEEALRAKLENVQSHLQQSEQFHGKLNQLWAQLQLVRESSRIYGGDEDDKGWASVSEKDMQTISKVLEDQQNGLAHVMKILRDDVQDAIVLSQALQEHSQ